MHGQTSVRNRAGGSLPQLGRAKSPPLRMVQATHTRPGSLVISPPVLPLATRQLLSLSGERRHRAWHAAPDNRLPFSTAARFQAPAARVLLAILAATR